MRDGLVLRNATPGGQSTGVSGLEIALSGCLCRAKSSEFERKRYFLVAQHGKRRSSSRLVAAKLVEVSFPNRKSVLHPSPQIATLPRVSRSVTLGRHARRILVCGHNPPGYNCAWASSTVSRLWWAFAVEGLPGSWWYTSSALRGGAGAPGQGVWRRGCRVVHAVFDGDGGRLFTAPRPCATVRLVQRGGEDA